MPEQRQGASAPEGAEPQLKVTDRRRFRPDGEPAEAAQAAPPAPSPAPPDEGEAPDASDDRLAAQATRIDELTRAYAALLEDNKAFRQRLEREKVRVLDAERASLAQALLDAADDLERALGAVSGAGELEGQPLQTLVEGVRLSLGALHRRIAQLGAERISVAGQRFDPHLAEAVDTVAVSDAEQDEMVVQEVRAGWRIGDRILRPARVRVGRIARA